MSLSLLEQVTLPAPSGDFDASKVFVLGQSIGAFEIAYLGEQFKVFLEKGLSEVLEPLATRPVLLQYVDCIDSEPTAEIIRVLGGPIGAVPLRWLVAVMADQKLSTSLLNKLLLEGSKNVFLTLDFDGEPCWVYVSLKDNRWYIGGGVPTRALAKNEGRRFFGRRFK